MDVTHIFPGIPEGGREAVCGIIGSLEVEEEALQRVREVEVQLHDDKEDDTQHQHISNNYMDMAVR